MDQTTFIHESTQATRKVQALLQQLIAHRGQPESMRALTPHATQCLQQLFELSEAAGRHDWPTESLDEAKSTLIKHFPSLLTRDDPAWNDV